MVTTVDDEYYDQLVKFKWQAVLKHKTWYARRIYQTNNKRTVLLMHRVIMGAKNGDEIDHIDGNGLNNAKSNLRFCTHRQNAQNTNSRCNSTSIYKGVYWDKSKNYWTSTIFHNGKSVFIGGFISEYSAAVAYNKHASELFGEFARLNAIEMPEDIENFILDNKSNRKNKKSSTFRGVSFFKPTMRWRATLTVNKHMVFSGYFMDEISAAKAYDGAAIRFLGDSAKVNFA